VVEAEARGEAHAASRARPGVLKVAAGLRARGVVVLGDAVLLGSAVEIAGHRVLREPPHQRGKVMETVTAWMEEKGREEVYWMPGSGRSASAPT
jgi:hypothetical protein